jgi:hypothetical protein
MVSGEESSARDAIRAAHIIPAVTKLSTLGALNLTADDVNDVRNGLLLAHGIEREFDSLGVCFVRHPLKLEVLIMKVWSETAKTTPIIPGSNKMVADFGNSVLQLTSADGSMIHKPFLRGLAFHAYQSYLKWKVIADIVVGNEPADYSSDLSTPFSSPRVLGLKMMLHEVHAQVAEADENSGKSSGTSSIVDSSVLVVVEEEEFQLIQSSSPRCLKKRSREAIDEEEKSDDT